MTARSPVLSSLPRIVVNEAADSRMNTTPELSRTNRQDPSEPRPDRFWLWLSLATGAGAVLEAVIVRVFGIDEGRIGSYIGILIIATALAAVLSGIAAYTGWRSALGASAGVMAIGGGAEIFGLYSAVPFGRYEYTDWWLPYVTLPGGKLYPLLLPPTWFICVALWYLLVARRLSGWALILGVALLAALTDVALEPVLTRVVLFWRWLEPTPLWGAPYRNFVGWFVTAGLGAGCLHAFGIWRAREVPHPVWMLPLGLLFTAVIGLTYGEPRGSLALVLIPPVVWFGSRA